MRTKIIVGNLLTILVVGLVSYAVVKSSLESALVDEVDSRIVSDFRMLGRSFRLSARDTAESVEDQAAQRAMVDVFVSALDESASRTRATQAADRTAAWLADPVRRGAAPDLVAVIDDAGRVVARNADQLRMRGEDLGAVPAVRAAITGDTGTGIWFKADERKVLQIVTAPIRHEGRVLGALLVGYDVSNGLARGEGALLGRDVAFVVDDRIYSSSLEQGAQTEALRANLFGPSRTATEAAMNQGASSAPFTVNIEDREYVAVVGALPGSAESTTHLAMVVLASRTDQLQKASSVQTILLMTILGVLLVLAYGFLVANTLQRPIEQIEEAVLAVINGRTDTRIDIQSAEFGGLAYRLNQLLNVFTGTPEGDESTQAGPDRWQDDSITQSAGAPAPAAGTDSDEDPAAAEALASEPEDAYYLRTYEEYVAAKQALGEDVSNITQDKFVQRLKANEQSLIKKNECRSVRFQVEVRGSQVNLKPVIMR